jgi:ketosteroid isomerase-like protein
MDTLDIVNAYLTAFYKGDFEAARRQVADAFSFRGPFVSFDDAAPFFASASPLKAFVRGHDVLRQWREADEVCTFYEARLETPAGKGAVPMAEWNRVEDGKVASARLIFDTAAFRKLLPMADA